MASLIEIAQSARPGKSVLNGRGEFGGVNRGSSPVSGTATLSLERIRLCHAQKEEHEIERSRQIAPRLGEHMGCFPPPIHYSFICLGNHGKNMLVVC